MNGQKLGQQHPKLNKNSFVYDNEFLNYDDEESEEELSSQQPIKKEDKYKKSKVKEEQKDKETKKISKINEDISKLTVNVHDLKEKYNDLNLEERMFKKRNQRKQRAIQHFLTEKKRQKKSREKKIKNIQQKQAKKLHQSLTLKEQAEKQRSKRRIDDDMRKMIRQKQTNSLKKKIQNENNKIVEEMYEKIYAEEKVKKKFHFRKEEEDKLKQAQRQKEQYEYLRRRKQRYKPLDIESLQEHEKQHVEKVNRIVRERRQRRQKQYMDILEQNDKFDDLYRGQAYDYVLDELQEQKMKKQFPKERNKKIKQYQEYVRNNFIPRTHRTVDYSIDLKENDRSTLSHRQVKRYRFLNGVAIGEVTENKPLVKSQAQQRKMGNQYLQYLRQLPKKKIVQKQPQIPIVQLQLLDQKLNQIVRVKRQRNPLYQKSKKKDFQMKISEKPSRDEVKMVINQLKNQDDKMKMRQKIIKNETNNATQFSNKQKQINNQMVDNIERKLNLLAKLSA